MTRHAFLLASLALAACQQSNAGPDGAAEAAPGAVPDAESTEAYDGIGPDETLHLTGTEPFWGGEVRGSSMTYTTPEDPEGTEIGIERFAGRGGLSFSGSLDGAALEMTATPLPCSDGMSDRTYPFTVTLKLGEELRNGCGWTEREPFEGTAQP